MKKLMLGAAALIGAATAPANAAVNIVVEGGGTPVVFEDNGSRFALLGIDARPASSTATTVDIDFVNSIIKSGPLVVGLFGCTGGLGSLSCTPNASIDVQPGQRLFDSLLAQFDGSGNVVFGTVTGGTTTLSLAVTQQGQPPIASQVAVPEPGTWAMLLLGFFTIGASMRAKTSRRFRLKAA